MRVCYFHNPAVADVLHGYELSTLDPALSSIPTETGNMRMYEVPAHGAMRTGFERARRDYDFERGLEGLLDWASGIQRPATGE